MTISPQRSRLSHEASEAVNTACARQLEELLWRIRNRELTDISHCHDALGEWQVDECLVADLDLSEQLSLVEEHAEDHGFELGQGSLDTLRSRIESLAASVAAALGADRARQVFEEVETLLEDLGLPLESVVEANPFDMFPHYAERDEGAWHVYEYRNLEDEELHADIWEYEACGINVYLRQWLENA